MFIPLRKERLFTLTTICITAATVSQNALAEPLPIVDAHVHYSHDSVQMTPPTRVIELMREAGLRRALVSSSDDNGTQLLSALAPDLIIPGLRPYRQRGETGTWFRDPAALEYVEMLLAKNRYASIGEFHLYGDNADLPIPKRIVELAVQHNLILHAHSDADAVRRLFTHNPNIKILWAHAGFDNPQAIDVMLGQYPNLWADLAFRSDMASGSEVDPQFKALFEKYPNRLMLGTDTYTPERIYYIPENAQTSRQWLSTLPDSLAQNIAWRNAEALLTPVWNQNRNKPLRGSDLAPRSCSQQAPSDGLPTGESGKPWLNGQVAKVHLQAPDLIQVSQPFEMTLAVCPNESLDRIQIDATMPRHGHGMNYQATLVQLSSPGEMPVRYQARGLILHMPGQWQWRVTVSGKAHSETLTADFEIH